MLRLVLVNLNPINDTYMQTTKNHMAGTKVQTSNVLKFPLFLFFPRAQFVSLVVVAGLARLWQDREIVRLRA